MRGGEAVVNAPGVEAATGAVGRLADDRRGEGEDKEERKHNTCGALGLIKRNCPHVTKEL